ncbi:MAG: hypothetical protein CL844_08890 [Crocinitomicaceae bacterium]|nr:hypothetical protein [Crocinitomicaceae bacterium]|tara:strand:- start:51510 stop:52202 length:693 start_codon:yes stop_codon:yes gene_type:complete
MCFFQIALFFISKTPGELIYREAPINIIIVVGLFLSFLFLSIARLVKTDVYFLMLKSFIKIKGLRLHIRDVYPVKKGDSIFLVFNYIVSSITILLIFFDTLSNQNGIYYLILIPFILFFLPIGFMYLVSILSGENFFLLELVVMKVVGAQFLGLFYFVFTLFFVLISFPEEFLLKLILISFFIENTYRLFKSFVIVYTQGVSFYYIILYFCTLEILPYVIGYYFISGYFV